MGSLVRLETDVQGLEGGYHGHEVVYTELGFAIAMNHALDAEASQEDVPF